MEFVLSTCIQASPRSPRTSADVRTAFKREDENEEEDKDEDKDDDDDK